MNHESHYIVWTIWFNISFKVRVRVNNDIHSSLHIYDETTRDYQ